MEIMGARLVESWAWCGVYMYRKEGLQAVSLKPQLKFQGTSPHLTDEEGSGSRHAPTGEPVLALVPDTALP